MMSSERRPEDTASPERIKKKRFRNGRAELRGCAETKSTKVEWITSEKSKLGSTRLRERHELERPNQDYAPGGRQNQARRWQVRKQSGDLVRRDIARLKMAEE